MRHLWATLSGGNALTDVVVSAQHGDNTAFSSAELKCVEASIAEIRAAIVSSGGEVSRRLDRIDASPDYGRKDWLNVAVLVVVSIISTAIPPDTARHILTVGGSVLQRVFGGSPLLHIRLK